MYLGIISPCPPFILEEHALERSPEYMDQAYKLFEKHHQSSIINNWRFVFLPQ